MRCPSALVATAVLLGPVVATGCHDPAPSAEQQVREVLTQFATSVEKRDYQRLCEQIFAPKLLQGLQTIGLPCEVAMRQSLGPVKDPRLTVGAVSVKDARAQAEIRTSAAKQPPSSDTIELQKLNGKWKVSALSATQPQPASP